MGCNSSKDGTTPSTQGGDSAPKDKPEDGSDQQRLAKHDVTTPPSDDQVSNGNVQEEVQEISDETGYNASHSQNKYEIPSENSVGDTNEIKKDEDKVTGEPEITDMSEIRDQNDNEENDIGQLRLEENGGKKLNTPEPQQTESGGETTNDGQTTE